MINVEAKYTYVCCHNAKESELMSEIRSIRDERYKFTDMGVLRIILDIHPNQNTKSLDKKLKKFVSSKEFLVLELICNEQPLNMEEVQEIMDFYQKSDERFDNT